MCSRARAQEGDSCTITADLHRHPLGYIRSKRMQEPTPRLSTDASPVAPAIACQAQRTTELTLSGAGLSPVPIDVPNHPAIAIPSIALVRAHELDAASADNAATSNVELLQWASASCPALASEADAARGGALGATGPWAAAQGDPPHTCRFVHARADAQSDCASR